MPAWSAKLLFDYVFQPAKSLFNKIKEEKEFQILFNQFDTSVSRFFLM